MNLLPSADELITPDSELCRLANLPLDDSPIDHLPSIELSTDELDSVIEF